MERLAVSIEEAAEALGLSRAHGYVLAKRGVIPTKRISRRRVVPVEALRKMLAEPDRQEAVSA